MRVEDFTRAHAPILESWLHSRSISLNLADLPLIGFVAYVNDKPVACAFLRIVEGRLGMLDALCSDPNAESAHRHEALDAMISAVKEKAKSMGYQGIFAHTVDKGTLLRSIKHGFEATPHTLIVSDFSKEL